MIFDFLISGTNSQIGVSESSPGTVAYFDSNQQKSRKNSSPDAKSPVWRDGTKVYRGSQ